MDNIRSILEALIDALIDPAKREGMVSGISDGVEGNNQYFQQDVAGCIKAIYLILLADAGMLKVKRAMMLLPDLRSATTVNRKRVSRDREPS